MRATPAVLRVLVRATSVDSLRRRPRPEEWSPAEVIGHLADTEERAMGRVRRMLAGDQPHLPGYDQAALAVERRYSELDPLAEVERYSALRAGPDRPRCLTSLTKFPQGGATPSTRSEVRPSRHNGQCADW